MGSEKKPKPVILDEKYTIILEKLYEPPQGYIPYATLYKATEPIQCDDLYRKTLELQEAGLISIRTGGCKITDFGKEVMTRLNEDEKLEKQGFKFRTNQPLPAIFESEDLEIAKEHGYSTGDDLLSSKIMTNVLEEAAVQWYQKEGIGFDEVKIAYAYYPADGKPFPEVVAIWVPQSVCD